ncbi:MAG: four helix bundle protein [Desulfobacteraceae bacterium]|nr:four helix bundle protein [Desulfobacteraceae bacterium]MBC2719338.1 four helix bundle protein [Desulfobacteraceae bacterium]
MDIANDMELFPKKRVAWIISDQILRSSSSISANISEGFGLRSSSDYIHFLVISRGSTTETQNWLIKCRDLGYMTEEIFDERSGICSEIVKMLNALIGSLQRKIS